MLVLARDHVSLKSEVVATYRVSLQTSYHFVLPLGADVLSNNILEKFDIMLLPQSLSCSCILTGRFLPKCLGVKIASMQA
jgi:hypothetical protein